VVGSVRTEVTTRTATDEDVPALAGLAAAHQADPRRHLGEFGPTADGIARQLEELDPGGVGSVIVATAGDEVVGFLGAEWDDDPPRVWWFGPVIADDVDWQSTADLLYAAAHRLLPVTVTEEEFGPDGRHTELPAFATRHGFERHEASVLLGRPLPGDDLDALTDVTGAPDLQVRPFRDTDRPATAVLHDELFPNTHLPGARLDEGTDRAVLVAERAGALVGYVAAERQEDGTGYVDFLGVAGDQRGSGSGRLLVAAACRELVDRFGCTEVFLTVRVSNVAARRVYAACGFEEERELVPWRKGFRPPT
jgi:ribosomal protein S18 acetylase RimI-like enzyme